MPNLLPPSIASLTKRGGFLGGTVKADPSIDGGPTGGGDNSATPDGKYGTPSFMGTPATPSVDGGPTTQPYYDPQYLDKKPPTPAPGGGPAIEGLPTPAAGGGPSFGGVPTPAPGGGPSFGGVPTTVGGTDTSINGGPTSVGVQPGGGPLRRPREDFPSFTGLMNRSGARRQIVY